MYVALNGAFSTLAAGIAAGDLTIPVQTGHGARFPIGTNHTYLWLEDASGNLECVKLTGQSSDNLTVVRGQDGTVARSWNSGDIIECRPCKAAIADIATAAQIAESSEKATPADADKFGFIDSAASWVLKYLTWANLVKTLSAVFQGQTHKSYTTGGTSTAYTLTTNGALAELTTGEEWDVTFNAAAGATPTLARDGLTAKSLKYRDSTGAKQAVTSTQIPLNWRSKVVYDGTDYIVREVADSSEYVESVVSNVSAGTSGQWFDVTSISVPPGKWDVSVICECTLNGATMAGIVSGGIGTETGNSSAGLVAGDTRFNIGLPTASIPADATIPAKRVTLGATTTYYLKGTASYSAGTPKFAGRILARRAS